MLLSLVPNNIRFEQKSETVSVREDRSNIRFIRSVLVFNVLVGRSIFCMGLLF